MAGKSIGVEKDLRKWLKDGWKGWMEWREPAKGCGVGAPDAQLLMGCGGPEKRWLLPVELKRWGNAMMVDGNRRISVLMRPQQINWHNAFMEGGGTSAVVCSFHDIPGKVVIVPWGSFQRGQRNWVESQTSLDFGELLSGWKGDASMKRLCKLFGR
jgi:hypothetical protein